MTPILRLRDRGGSFLCLKNSLEIHNVFHHVFHHGFHEGFRWGLRHRGATRGLRRGGGQDSWARGRRQDQEQMAQRTGGKADSDQEMAARHIDTWGPPGGRVLSR